MLDRHQAGSHTLDPWSGATVRHQRWQRAVRELPANQLYHLQWHLLRLEDGGRASRFGDPTCDAFVRACRESIDGADTLVLGCFADGYLRGAAGLRVLPSSDGGRTAEIAFSVEAPWQGRGIGTALMAAVVRAARERGIERLSLSCHALNHRMQRIAERFMANVGFEDCEYVADIAVAQR